MPKYYYFNPRSEDDLELALKVAKGKKVKLPKGCRPHILTPAEWHEQPRSNHPHPVGYPCFKSCYMFWLSAEEWEFIPDLSDPDLSEDSE